MNKQTIIGFVLIGAILFGFSWYQSSQQKKFQEEQRIADSIARANAPAEVPVIEGSMMEPGVAIDMEPAAPVVQADPLGEVMAAARTAESQTFTVENDVAVFEFSTLGGVIADVVLKDYTKYGGDPLHLWKPGSEMFDAVFFMRREGRDAQVNTRQFNFGHEITDSGDHKKVSMRLPVGDGGNGHSDSSEEIRSYVEFVYTIPRADYMIGFEVRFVGMEGMMSNQSSFGIDWGSIGLQNEKGFDNENNYTTISYHYPDTKGIEEMGIARAGSSKQQSEQSKVQWVAFKQHYFSSILVADEAFRDAELRFDTFQPGSGEIKKFSAGLTVPMERGRDTYGFRMYLGPNKFSMLKQYGLGMERIISMGWMSFGWVSRAALIPLFEWLSSHGLGIGWVILLMTFIIKLVIFPLTFTSYKSSAKMRVIKPEVDEINARYPDKEDAMKKQQATMELYRRAGINPMMGCIPMLIQMPIIIAMFRFFPSAIELRGQRLWWADDLSSYDSILDLGFKIPFYGDHISLFALLMAVSMFVYSWLNFKQQAAQPQMAGMKFMMLYMMPVMMLLWFNNYAAGLCFYYLLANLFTIAQIYGVRFAINEDKLRKKMLETPRKEKKKSGFMARLEEAQKAQLAAARQQQQAQGKGGGGSKGGGKPAPKKKK